MSENPEPSIDERIQALTMNLELLLKQGEETDKCLAILANNSERHEREIQRFSRAMRGALQAWPNEDTRESA